MIEYVFRPSRLIAGKRVVSRVFSGRYAVEKGARVVTVRLNTPDREIAKKRLRDIVVEKQREQEGIIAPSAVRVAAAAALSHLLDDYEADLSGRSTKYVFQTEGPQLLMPTTDTDHRYAQHSARPNIPRSVSKVHGTGEISGCPAWAFQDSDQGKARSH
jgi:hypothetical protein